MQLSGMCYVFSCKINHYSNINYNRPINKEELFNLRHASLRNVIERIFGVLKGRFRILLLATRYSLDIQVRIPSALCAIHNFIRHHDPDNREDSYSDDSDDDDSDGFIGMVTTGQTGARAKRSTLR